MNRRSTAIVFLVLMTAVWGTSFPMMRSLNLQVDQHFEVSSETTSIGFRTAAAAWIIGLRFSAAFVLFVVLFPQVSSRIRIPQVLAGAAIGLVFFAGVILQVIGLATIPASRSGFLTSLTVVFIPMISTVMRRKLPPATVLVAGGLAMLGVSVLTGLIDIGGGNFAIDDSAMGRWTFGDTLTILGAIFFSVQVILVDRLGRKYSSMEFTPAMFATSALCAALVFTGLVSSGMVESGQISNTAVGYSPWIALGSSPTFWGVIVALAIFPSLIAFAWMNKYQPAVSAVLAGIIYTLEPVFTSIYALFMPAMLSAICLVPYSNEPFTMPLLVGGLIVVMANMLALRADQEPE